jgi:hypothetical protein
MPLNIDFQDGDAYDKEYMRKSIFPQQFKNGHAYPENQILESIILGPDNLSDSIDMIARPYVRPNVLDGKKVMANEYGEFAVAGNGEFVIELRPKSKEITVHKTPEEVICCKKNHEYGIFKYSIYNQYEDTFTDVMINLFYKPSNNIKQ